MEMTRQTCPAAAAQFPTKNPAEPHNAKHTQASPPTTAEGLTSACRHARQYLIMFTMFCCLQAYRMIQVTCRLLKLFKLMPGIVPMPWAPRWLGAVSMVVAYVVAMLQRADTTKLRLGLLHLYPRQLRQIKMLHNKYAFKRVPQLNWIPRVAQHHLFWVVLLGLTLHADYAKHMPASSCAPLYMWAHAVISLMNDCADLLLPFAYMPLYGILFEAGAFAVLKLEAARAINIGLPVVLAPLALLKRVGIWLKAAVVTCLWYLSRAKNMLLSTAMSVWHHWTNILWVAVAALLVTMPLTAAILQSPGFARIDRELAFVLPFAALFLVYPHVWAYCWHHLLQKKLTHVWAWRVCKLQHAVFLGLLYNWYRLTETVFVMGSICSADAAGCVKLEGPHIAAHLVLSCIYAVLPVAVSAAAVSRPGPVWTKTSRGAAFLTGMLGVVLSQLQLVCKCMCESCVRAACAASQTVHHPLFRVLHICGACVASMWLLLAGFVAVLVHGPAQLLSAALALMLGTHTACCCAMQSLLQRLSLASAATAALLASTRHVQSGAAACAHDTTSPQSKGPASASGAANDDGVQQGMQATAPATARKKQRQKQVDSCVSDCVVCLDAPRSVALFPCNHVVLCGACFVGLQRQAERVGGRPCCPVCRTEVQQHAVGLILA